MEQGDLEERRAGIWHRMEGGIRNKGEQVSDTEKGEGCGGQVSSTGWRGGTRSRGGWNWYRIAKRDADENGGKHQVQGREDERGVQVQDRKEV